MTYPALGPHPHRFCWTFSREAVFGSGGCSFQVVPVLNLTFQTTIGTLCSILATHGLPELLVSDNRSSFTSAEFHESMKHNGIHHITSCPYHPPSNRLAKRAIQTFKTALEKTTSTDVATSLARILFRYRITPHSTTGVSPAELLTG